MSNQRRFCANCGHEQQPMMRLGLSLPDELVFAVRQRAAVRSVPISEVIAEAIRFLARDLPTPKDGGEVVPLHLRETFGLAARLAVREPEREEP